MTPTNLIVEHTFGSKLVVSSLVKIHIFACWIAEALTKHELEFTCFDGANNESCLWNPLASSGRMMVVTNSCIESYVLCYLLTNIGITSHLILMSVCALHLSLRSQHSCTSFFVLIPSVSVDMLVVDACSYAS